jgi:hypothetical protein
MDGAITTINSSYADLVITGIVGLRPRADNVVEVHPLLPDGGLGLVLFGQRAQSWPHAHDPMGQDWREISQGEGSARVVGRA